MALVRPQVEGPLSELSRTIRVSGHLDGALVTISSVGAASRVLASGVLSGGNDRLTLPAGVDLRYGDLVVAMQELGGDTSPGPGAYPGMPLHVPVQAAPQDLAAVGHVNLVSTPWECGRHLWVQGGIPGAMAQALFGGNVAGEGELLDTEGARLTLTRYVPHGTTVSVRQVVAGVGSGPTQDTLSAALPGDAGLPVPAPAIEPAPVACHTAVRIAKVFDGAEVVLTRSDASSSRELRAPFDRDTLWFPLDAPLNSAESLTVRQEVEPRCGRPAVESNPPSAVLQAPPIPMLAAGPLCVNSPLVHVEQLIPGAPVRIFVNGEQYDGQAPRDRSVYDFAVAPLPPGTVALQQSQCGVWGPQTVVKVNPAPAAVPTPHIAGDLFACATEVSVVDLHPGAIARVVSGRLGPISGYVVALGSECTIPVAPSLRAGDDISVWAWACGGGTVESPNVTVQDHPHLGQPHMELPVFIGTTAVHFSQLVPGARLRVNVSDGSTGAAKQWKVVVTTPKGEAKVTFDDHFADGDLITAHQFLCGEHSEPVRARVTLQPITPDWWSWDGPSPTNAEWNREYTVSGVFTNKGTTPLADLHLTFWENTTSPGDASPGHLNPSQSTNASLPELKKDWSWFTPGIWLVRGPNDKTFIYRAEITANDQAGHPYPVVHSVDHKIIVQVSLEKMAAGITAESAAVYAAGLAIAAAAALVGILTAPLAAPLAAVAAAAYAVAAGAGAVALDPPEPDPLFQQRVELPAAPQEDSGLLPELRPLGVLLATMAQISTIRLLMSTMEGRWLGALAVGAGSWAQVQAQDFAHARTVLMERAAAVTTLHEQAVPGLLPIIRQLQPAFDQARQELLEHGLPDALVQTRGLPPEAIEQLNLVVRSQELATRYPDIDPMAALAECVRRTGELGAAAAETPPLGD